MSTVKQDNLPSVDQLDVVNKGLLPVMRHFLNAFLRPDSLGWRTAMAAAVGTWGEARGLAIAYSMQAFLAAVLKGRPVPINYADPLDIVARTRLTADEIDLLALIASMRRDQTASARDIIARVTGGKVDAAIVRTGLQLAGMLDPAGDRRKKPIRPKLRAVS
jgi:hypothetical protein